MKQIEIDEMKKIQLDILTDVAKFCEEKNITYFLSYGTLIGAIRHKGFIPWDDDIDISMPRPDYERFLKLYKHKVYKILAYNKNNKVLCTYAKVYDNRTVLEENGDFGEKVGINIDVFPLDGIPSNKFKLMILKVKLKLLWGMNVAAIIKDCSARKLKNRIIIRTVKIFYKIFPIQHYITGLFIKELKKCRYEDSKYMGVCIIKNTMLKEYSTDLIKKQFENRYFFVPKKYDEYLREIYGNYLEFPPENERVYKHNSKAYWRE